VSLWISTDLDGTLLDHHNYSYASAQAALDLCSSREIPIMLNTSKTEAETRKIHAELKLSAPIGVENGSALVFLDGIKTTQVFGKPRAQILDFIDSVRSSHDSQLSGFNDLGVKGIVQHTGLSEEAAELAADRHYSEPFLWHGTDTELSQFTELAAQHNLVILKGGRFYHLQGQTDKAQPLTWIRKHSNIIFSKPSESAQVIALGDNHNDVAMLNVADYPVCVRSYNSPFPKLSTKKAVLYTKGIGPLGWNEAIQSLLHATN